MSDKSLDSSSESAPSSRRSPSPVEVSVAGSDSSSSSIGHVDLDDLGTQMCEFIFQEDYLTRAQRDGVWEQFLSGHPEVKKSPEELKIFFFKDVLKRISEIYPSQFSSRRLYFCRLPYNPQMAEIVRKCNVSDEFHNPAFGTQINASFLDDKSFLDVSGILKIDISVQEPPKCSTFRPPTDEDQTFFKWYFEVKDERDLTWQDIKDLFREYRDQGKDFIAEYERKLAILREEVEASSSTKEPSREEESSSTTPAYQSESSDQEKPRSKPGFRGFQNRMRARSKKTLKK